MIHFYPLNQCFPQTLKKRCTSSISKKGKAPAGPFRACQQLFFYYPRPFTESVAIALFRIQKTLNNQKIALDKIHGSTPKNDGFSKFWDSF